MSHQQPSSKIVKLCQLFALNEHLFTLLKEAYLRIKLFVDNNHIKNY